MTQGDKRIPRNYFYADYDNISRFLCYYHQCRSALDLEPETVLEIGVGNKTVTNYLKERGIQVTTCDYAEDLKPDFVADIRNLSCFKDESFDLVMACEVLEHMPWEDIDKALQEIKRVTKKSVILSLPCSRWPICLSGAFPLMSRIFKKDRFNIIFRIPRFFLKPKGVESHCWEIGSKGYPMKKIKAKLGSYLHLEKDFPSVWNAYSHFFILSKKP